VGGLRYLLERRKGTSLQPTRGPVNFWRGTGDSRGTQTQKKRRRVSASYCGEKGSEIHAAGRNGVNDLTMIREGFIAGKGKDHGLSGEGRRER